MIYAYLDSWPAAPCLSSACHLPALSSRPLTSSFSFITAANEGAVAETRPLGEITLILAPSNEQLLALPSPWARSRLCCRVTLTIKHLPPPCWGHLLPPSPTAPPSSPQAVCEC